MYWTAKITRALGREPEAKLPSRFEGDAGQEQARSVLLNNPAVGDNEDVANRLLATGNLTFFRRGNPLIKEGDHDNDVYFLLAGEVDIVFGTRLGSIRSSPNQVGEMAAIDPGKKRSANVIARSDEVAALRVPVAFSSKDYGADAETDLSPTLRAGGHSASHANGGVPPAVAFAIQERAICENPNAGPDGVGGARTMRHTHWRPAQQPKPWHFARLATVRPMRAAPSRTR